MSTRRRRAGLPGLAGLAAALVLAAPAAAEPIRLKPAMTAAYTIGTGIEGDEADLSRLELIADNFNSYFTCGFFVMLWNTVFRLEPE